MRVDTDRGFYRCYRCGARGSFKGTSYVEEAAEVPGIEKPEGLYPLDSVLARAGRYYMEKERGFPRNVLEDAEVAFSTSGRCLGRVVVPSFGEDGSTWRWYSARVPGACAAGMRKYISPKGALGSHLYNERVLDVGGARAVCVLEGCFDVLAVWPYGVALWGGINPVRLERLLSSQRDLIITLDTDKTAEARRATAWLRGRGFPRAVTYMPLPEDRDIDELFLQSPKTAGLFYEAATQRLAEDRKVRGGTKAVWYEEEDFSWI
jgi:hypothetical protein